eukprot:7368433-Alexandrium_andersonii.AAC.1
MMNPRTAANFTERQLQRPDFQMLQAPTGRSCVTTEATWNIARTFWRLCWGPHLLGGAAILVTLVARSRSQATRSQL